MNPALLSMIPAGLSAISNVKGLLDIGGNRSRKKQIEQQQKLQTYRLMDKRNLLTTEWVLVRKCLNIQGMAHKEGKWKKQG